MLPSPGEILAFWRSAGPKRWWKKSKAFDAEVRRRLEAAHLAASRGELGDWTETAEGALALIILTDQVPRNLYRGSAHAYATDCMAQATSCAAIAAGLDRKIEPALRYFFYMPLMHAEDLALQEKGVRLFTKLEAEGGEDNRWARDHREIIERFGRFQHRNACLGRETTTGEQAFLDAGGFAG
jgi:uncharacterized protein (DUF924 family)